MKASQISLPGPIQCEYCGTEHKATRFRNVPYFVAGGLFSILIVAWFTGFFSREIFIVLFGAWLVFDLLWGRFVPLQSVSTDKNENWQR